MLADTLRFALRDNVTTALTLRDPRMSVSWSLFVDIRVHGHNYIDTACSDRKDLPWFVWLQYRLMDARIHALKGFQHGH